jgi:hypothetical protein
MCNASVLELPDCVHCGRVELLCERRRLNDWEGTDLNHSLRHGAQLVSVAPQRRSWSCVAARVEVTCLLVPQGIRWSKAIDYFIGVRDYDK